jgi:diaminopimelate epimerase
MIPFSHYHGLGNSFLVLDCRSPIAQPTPEDARTHCAQGTGEDVDGLLCIEEGRAGANYHMRILNRDGSEPEMCGNGLRCVVKHIVDRWGHLETPLTISTRTGLHTARWELDDGGNVHWVAVSMGPPSRIPSEIPILGGNPPARVRISVEGTSHSLECVSMGNPHAVRFGSASRELAERLGPVLQKSAHFPEGANIGFAEVESPTRVHLVVYERGCGITEACGTGACASVVAAIDQGLVSADQEIDVILPGGRLQIRVERDHGEVWMAGPAVHVTDGQLPLAEEPAA